jgi:hypothetical protein
MSLCQALFVALAYKLEVDLANPGDDAVEDY